MNYRRGFQRVYSVLAVAWVALFFATTPRDRLRFWTPDIDYDALAEQARAIDEDPYAKYGGRSVDSPPPAPRGVHFVDTPDRDVAPKPRVQKFLWVAAWVALPPLCSYIMIFAVIPWIYRGFRPATQI